MKRKQKKIEMVIICLFLLMPISFMILESFFLMTNPLKNNEDLRELNSPKLSTTPLWSYNTDGIAFSVAISDDGRYITASSQGNKIYFFGNSSSTPVWVNSSAGIWQSMSSDGKYIASLGGVGKEVVLFNRSSSTPLWTYNIENWITDLAISSDGNYIIVGCSSDNKINVFFFNTTNILDPLLWSFKSNGNIKSVAISSSGNYIAVGADNWDIYLFNKSSSIPKQIWSISDDIRSVSISSNGEFIVVGSRNKNVYLFDKSRSSPLWIYTLEDDVIPVAISRDGNYIAAGDGNGYLYLFQRSQSTPLWSYKTGISVRSITFSDDGNHLIVGSNALQFTAIVHIFKVLESTPLGKYSAAGNHISVSVSANGDYIVAGINDNIYLLHKSNFDDDYEENDNFNEASLLTEGNYTDLTLNEFDQDYFRINFDSGIKIEIEILFDHNFGNLNLYLYDPSQIQINSSESNTDDEHVSYISNSSGFFTILVDSTSDNSIQPYELRIKILVIPNVDENGNIDIPPINWSLFGLSFLIIAGIAVSVGLVYANYHFRWFKNFSKSHQKKKQRKLKEKEFEHSKTMLNPIIRKILYFIPILVFYWAWWFDIGTSISYLAPYLENQDLTIVEWIIGWPYLTDDFLIYMNTFSSLFFGCYSWSIIAYYLGTKNPKRFKRAVKSIYLCYPFWLILSIYLGIIGVESYFNEWLFLHIVLGIWVASGSIISTLLVLAYLVKFFNKTKTKIKFDLIIERELKYEIPRPRLKKILDFFERFQPLFFILIFLPIGTFLSINIILVSKRFTNLVYLNISWTFLALLSIFLINFLFSMRFNYHAWVKQEEEELLLNEFQVLLRKSKELAERGKKNYSKKYYQPAIENWEKSINYYEEALKKTTEKKRIKENLIILKESMFNAYKGRANVHNKNALKAYEKPDLQIAQKEWRLANSNFQAAINLIKVDKLNFSSDKLQKATKNIEIRLKQLEIEMDILDADNELKKARSFQKKDLRKAIKMVNGIIIKFSEAKEKSNKNALFKPLSETLETRIINCRRFQHKLQEKMDEMIGITPISKRIIVDEINIIDSEIPSVRKEDVKKPILSIIREFEFIGGQLRFKIGLKNNTQYSLTSLKITFDIPKALKWILHEPGYERKGDSLLISKLGVNEKKVISLYLEPINCMESSINATISFYDVRDKPHALTMKPKMISITCPIFFTEVDANLARVKSLRRRLAHHDKKIFPLIRSEESFSIFSSILSVLEKFDIKLTFKDFSEEDRFGEAWFYGITKVKKNQIVIYVLLDGENRKIEVEVSGNDEPQITAFLAEIGDRTRKQLIHNKIIDIEDDFYDIRVSILSKLCPYCYTSISGDRVQKFIDGKLIQCKNCDVELKVNEK